MYDLMLCLCSGLSGLTSSICTDRSRAVLLLWMLFGDGCWHPDSILTLTVFQSRRVFPLPGHTLNICYTPCKFSDI